MGLEFLLRLEQWAIKLDGTDQIVNFAFVLKVEQDSVDEVPNININFDKNIHDLPLGLRDGHKTRMAVMHQQIAVELITSNIVDTTGPVGDISQYYSVAAGEDLDDVADQAAEQHEAFGELQGYW